MRTRTSIALAALGTAAVIVTLAVTAAQATAEPETKIQFVETTTTITSRTTATVVTTAPPVTLTETVVETVPPVTETVTATETVTVTEEAAMAADEGASADWPLPAGWYFVPGLEASTGMWARAAFDGSHVQVDPSTPEYLRSYLVLHETGHLVQAQVFGNVTRTPGSYESVADCYAVLMGWSGSLTYGCTDSAMATARGML